MPTSASLLSGTELPITKRSKNVYRVSIKGIKALQLFDRYVITVYDGENEIAGVSLSPMSYVYLVLNNINQFDNYDIIELVAAFYRYAYYMNRMV